MKKETRYVKNERKTESTTQGADEAAATSELGAKGTTKALPYMSNSVIQKATFQNGKKFRGHFSKHKKEFSSGITKDEYLAGARNLLSSSPDGVNVFAKVRKSDGAYVVFNKSTDEFGIIGKDGIIQTYYIPNPAKHGYKTNYDYYLSQ